MNIKYSRIVSFVLVCAFSLTLIGCSNRSQSMENPDSEEYQSLSEKIDRILAKLGTDDSSLPVLQKFREANAEDRAEMALDLVDDKTQDGSVSYSLSHIFLIKNNYICTIYSTGRIIKYEWVAFAFYIGLLPEKR